MALYPTGIQTSVQMVAVVNSAPTDGNVWYDSSQKALQVNANGVTQSFSTALFVATASKTVGNTGTETSAVPTGVGTVTLPANFLVAGKVIRISGGGVFSTLITPGTLTVKVKLGSVVVASVAITNLLASAANNAFQFAGTMVCRTAGVSGTVMADGQADYDSGTLVRGFAALNNAGATSTVDTTGALLVDVTVTWGTSNAANTLTTTNCCIEVLN